MKKKEKIDIDDIDINDFCMDDILDRVKEKKKFLKYKKKLKKLKNRPQTVN